MTTMLPVKPDVFHVYDTTLRDGAQQEGLQLNVSDKLKIARYLDAPVIYVAMRRVRRGRYSAHLHLVAEPPYDDDPEAAIVDRYASLLEAEIARAPADFLWVHRKWKYPKPDAEAAPVASAPR